MNLLSPSLRNALTIRGGSGSWNGSGSARGAGGQRRRTTVSPALAALLALLLLGGGARAQAGGGMPPGVSREAMWWAPTAEDWAKPVLIRFQRTWEDAVALARETGQPLLVCVNMDGEIASEHYAGVRYRQPEIAALYEPYVCVIASVYRHNPADFDEAGRRVLCPRFGSVTCGEHIAIEPGLYGAHFDEKRIAPRHIAVELDGSESYDVFYRYTTDEVFAEIREGAAGRPPPRERTRGEGTLVERVSSPDARDRDAIEAAYLAGNREQKAALLDAALASGGLASVDLLRLALTGLDPALADQARVALAQSTSPLAVELIEDELRRPLDAAQREALLAGLARLGESVPRARLLAQVHGGLEGAPSALDAQAWSAALAALAPAGPESYRAASEARVQRIEAQDATLASADPMAQIELAESFLQQGYDLFPRDAEHGRLLLMDARDTALLAESHGATGWRLHSVVANASYYLDELGEAYARADLAVRAGIPPDAADWNSMAVLAIYARSRQEAIQTAVAARRDWPKEALAELHSACTVLARHPHGTEEQLVAHHDFLSWLGARHPASDVLEQGLLRFPGSPDLHERLRRRVLLRRGPDGLEQEYAERLADPAADPAWLWFAAHASVVAAESHRRSGAPELAVTAYDRAVELFARDLLAHPDEQASVDRELALIHAARARLHFDAGDDEHAVEELLAAFALRADAAATADGLNLSPMDTARVLSARLEVHGPAALFERLRAAIAALDPALLRLPAWETQAPETQPGERRRGRRDP